LLRFKNKVRQSIKAQYKAAFDKLLREVRFERQVKEALDKAQELRSGRIAHSLEDMVLGKTEEPLVRFGDLMELRDHLVAILEAIAFNVDHMMHPMQYSSRVQHPAGVDSRSDIEELLDLIAEHSPALHLPEEQPEVWNAQREVYPERELRAFNEYRRKFGLSEA
jgi:hypothetical protein